MSSSELNDLVIIGSGPAGYTAAIYAARANLKPILIEGAFEAGGNLMLTTEVENFPGFPEGIMGPDLMAKLRAQAERFGTTFVQANATAVKITPEMKGVKTDDGQLFKSKSLILAMGSAPKKLGIDREDELSGRGVSYCGICDGAFYKNKPVMVVGGGDSAAEEALFLTKFATKVTMIVRGDTMRASKIMQDRVRKEERIEALYNASLSALNGGTVLESADVSLDGGTTFLDSYPVEGLFIAIGHTPRSDLVSAYVPLDEAGYILTTGSDTHRTATTAPGVFAAGDLVDHQYRQAITAAGSGAQAAMDAERWLEALKDAE